MSNYAGSEYRIRSGGNSVKVTIASNAGRGNGGTSLPCAGAYIMPRAANSGLIRWSVGAAATSDLGTEITKSQQPLFVPIDDVAKLYFYGASDNDVVDITYLTD